MVSDRELKEVLRQEEVKAIYDSIDYKELDRIVEEDIMFERYCGEHNTDYKKYHPMSYTVNKEVEEWERSAPLFKDMMNAEVMGIALGFGYLGMWMIISFLVIIYAIIGL